MTTKEFESKYRNRTSPPIKSFGVKSRIDLLTFSQLDDRAYHKGLMTGREWIDLVKTLPRTEVLSDEFISKALGQFINYNDLSWLTEDEFDKLLDVMKEALNGKYTKLGKVVAFFGGARGKDHYWLSEFCIDNRFTKSKLDRYYIAGTTANLDKEFKILNQELAYEY